MPNRKKLKENFPIKSGFISYYWLDKIRNASWMRARRSVATVRSRRAYGTLTNFEKHNFDTALFFVQLRSVLQNIQFCASVLKIIKFERVCITVIGIFERILEPGM